MSGSWNWAPGPKAQAWNWMPKCSAQPANARNLRRHAVADENIASKDGRFRIVSLTPDVFLTPSKNGVPVPYPITHQMNQSRQCSPNVFLQGKPVYLHNQSYVDRLALQEDVGDRKSTRLNSSHQIISYAVFCLKKKNRKIIDRMSYFSSTNR